ncbi:hypothetical protein OAO55_03330, partial [Bacteroidales bacterium]|nr:hypothetical protein [Bacteroidales bacterium]
MQNKWSASWVSPKSIDEGQSTILFRKKITVKKVNAIFGIHLASSHDYQLFVNGEIVDNHVNNHVGIFQTYDLSRYLLEGENSIAVLCVISNNSNKVCRILVQGNSNVEEVVNTNGSWKYYGSKAISKKEQVCHYRTVYFPSRWQYNYFNDFSWENCIQQEVVEQLKPTSGPEFLWIRRYFQQVHRVHGVNLKEKTIGNGKSIIIPRNTTVTMLLDADSISLGLLSLITTKGKGSEILIDYCESMVMYDTATKTKHPLLGDRNELLGKVAIGHREVYSLRGGFKEVNYSVVPQVFRFAQVKIITGEQEMKIDDIFYYEPVSSNLPQVIFHTDNKVDNKVWKLSYNTYKIIDAIYNKKVKHDEFNSFSDRLYGLGSLALNHDIESYKNIVASYLENIDSNILHNDTGRIIDFIIAVEMLEEVLGYKKDVDFMSKYKNEVANLIDYIATLVDASKCEFRDEAMFWDKQVIYKESFSDLMMVKLFHLYVALLSSEKILQQTALESNVDINNVLNCLKQHIIDRFWDKEQGGFFDEKSPKEWNNVANLLAVYSGVITDTNKVISVIEQVNSTGVPGEYTVYLFKTLKTIDYIEYAFDLSSW